MGTLKFWVHHLKGHLTVVTSTYRITELDYAYGCSSLSGA